MNKYVAYCPILLITTALGLGAQNLGANSDCATNPPDFITLSYEEANNAVKSEESSILGKRTKKICPEYITNLGNQLRRGDLRSDSKVLGIYLLGTLHPGDTNSVEVLIQYIDLRASKFDGKSAVRRWGEYPAAEALMKIGKPAVNPTLNHLPDEGGKIRRHLMCDVLKKVLGVNAAQDEVRRGLFEESGLTRRANLELALAEFGR